ncbi:uncharacterized protein FTOL_04431 [Fusarium torulosum]|uniref:Uncharacterized protein n=1 Tax=Fusarium torulosum TaxID=33205 RepID=A0AAE8SG40_9HYPO|nr:uncharacterized protein FTOL_04431 [Fusarium torulosum]
MVRKKGQDYNGRLPVLWSAVSVCMTETVVVNPRGQEAYTALDPRQQLPTSLKPPILGHGFTVLAGLEPD